MHVVNYKNYNNNITVKLKYTADCISQIYK